MPTCSSVAITLRRTTSPWRREVPTYVDGRVCSPGLRVVHVWSVPPLPPVVFLGVVSAALVASRRDTSVSAVGARPRGAPKRPRHGPLRPGSRSRSGGPSTDLLRSSVVPPRGAPRWLLRVDGTPDVPTPVRGPPRVQVPWVVSGRGTPLLSSPGLLGDLPYTGSDSSCEGSQGSDCPLHLRTKTPGVRLPPLFRSGRVKIPLRVGTDAPGIPVCVT